MRRAERAGRRALVACARQLRLGHDGLQPSGQPAAEPATGAFLGDAASVDSEAGLAEELEVGDDEGCGAAGPPAADAAAAAGAPGLPAAAHPQGASSPAAEHVLRPSDIYAFMRVPYLLDTLALWCTMPGADLPTLAGMLVDAQRHCRGDNMFAGKDEREMLAALPALTSFAAQLEPYRPGMKVFWNIAQTTTTDASGRYVYANTPGVWFTQHNMSLEHYALCEAGGEPIQLIASNANPCPTKVQPRRRCPVPVHLLLPACTELGSGLRNCPRAQQHRQLASSAAVCCQSAPSSTLPEHAHEGSLSSPL